MMDVSLDISLIRVKVSDCLGLNLVEVDVELVGDEGVPLASFNDVIKLGDTLSLPTKVQFLE